MLNRFFAAVAALGLCAFAGAESPNTLVSDTVADIANGAQHLEGLDTQGLMTALDAGTFRKKLSQTVDLTRSDHYDSDCGSYQPLQFYSIAKDMDEWGAQKLLDSPYDLSAAIQLGEHLREIDGRLQGEFSYAHHAESVHHVDYPACVDHVYYPIKELDDEWSAHTAALARVYDHLSHEAGPGAKNTNALIAELTNPSPEAVTDAVRLLIGRARTDEILARVDDKDPKIRYNVAYALWEYVTGAYKASGVFGEAMAKRLSDSDAPVREQAVGFFWALRDLRQEDAIAKMLGDSSPQVRIAALNYLGPGVKTSRYRKEMAALLNDPEPTVRARAQKVLDGLR